MSNESGVFKALADPTRRQILHDLQHAELSVGEIVKNFNISGPSISRHLSILKAAGLVQERRDANHIFYSLERQQLALSLSDFLSNVCPDQIIMRHKRRTRGKK